MTDRISLFNHSPELYVNDLVEAIKAGYRVTTSVDTFQYLNAPCHGTLTMLKGEVVPSAIFTEDKHQIAEYDQLTFVLKLQDAIIAGYELEGPAVMDHVYSATVVKGVEPAVEEKPTPKKTTRRKGAQE